MDPATVGAGIKLLNNILEFSRDIFDEKDWRNYKKQKEIIDKQFNLPFDNPEKDLAALDEAQKQLDFCYEKFDQQLQAAGVNK